MVDPSNRKVIGRHMVLNDSAPHKNIIIFVIAIVFQNPFLRHNTPYKTKHH